MSYENHVERRTLLLGLIASSFGGAAYAQSTSKILEDLARATLGRTGAASVPAPITTSTISSVSDLSIGDADGGLRQALSSAAIATARRLGRLDGYWADGRVRIPLPSPLNAIQSRFAPLQMSGPLDNFQLRLNRAAETTAPRAGVIFTDTIKSISITDAIEIVRGSKTAGTDMLRSRASVQLTELMTPPMTQAVDSSGAGAALDRINGRYGREIARLGGLSGLMRTPITTVDGAPTSSVLAGPLIFGAGASTTTPIPPSAAATPTAIPAGEPPSLKTQLIAFAVTKALDGLFLYIGEEERAIRSDPAKRTTDLLKRVFGKL
jgi:hypothetical protein